MKLQFAPLFDEKIISRENIITEKKLRNVNQIRRSWAGFSSLPLQLHHLKFTMKLRKALQLTFEFLLPIIRGKKTTFQEVHNLIIFRLDPRDPITSSCSNICNKRGCARKVPALKLFSPFETESIESVSLLVLSLEQTEVGLPLVANNLATGETSDGDNHLDIMKLLYRI